MTGAVRAPSLQLSPRARRFVITGAGVLVPTLIALAVAAWGLGQKPLWFDETFQALMAMMPPYQFARVLATFETSGALYHVFLWLWKFVGTSEVALRLPSVIFAVATIPVIFAIARRVVSTPWAAAAALVMALNGFWAHYAQEARPYALWLLTASLSTWALLRAVERPERRRWMVYAAMTVLAVWSHLMMIFVIAGQVLAMLAHPDVRRWWRPAAVAVAVSAIATVPIGISIMLASPTRWAWIGPPTAQGLWRGIATLAGSAGDLVTLAWIALLALGTAVVLWRWRRERRLGWPMLLLLTWAILPIIGPWLVSHLRPMYVPRYLFGALPAVILVIAIGLSAVRPKFLGMALLGVVLVAGSLGVARWHTREDRPDWRTATSLVVQQGTQTDGLAFFTPRTFDGGAMYQYRYYLTQFESSDRPTVVRLPDTSAPLEDRVRAAISDLPRLWAVAERFDEDETLRALAVVESQFVLDSEWELARLGVRLYVRDP